MLNKDPFNNLIFSIHTWNDWVSNGPASGNYYRIVQEFQELKNLKLPFVIGEFAASHPATVNGICTTLYFDVASIMRECLKHSFGYLGWSWAGNTGSGCGSTADLDIVANENWNTHTQFTPWGYELIHALGIGIRDTSKLATVF